MSDLLNAVAEKLGTPAELVSRSAEARATANGTSADEILEAWAGGASAAPAPPATEAPETEEEPETADEPDATPEPEQAPAPELEIPEPAPVPQVAAIEEPEEDLEPVSVRDRLRTAGRVGVWTGAALGLFAFVVATAFWSKNASVTGEETFNPVLIADSSGVLIGVGLVSVLFGAVVASFARAAAGWVNPAMRLSSSKASTSWVGGILGLVLGLGAGGVLTSGFGTPIEGSEGLVQMPVLTTLAVMLIGGAVLGWLTTLATQFFGVPITMDADESSEVGHVRTRLGNAVSIPIAGIILLVVLVLPFAWALIRSNHLTSGGAAIIAIITAAGILAFASLAGTRPNMRIGRGELMVAVAGIGIVVIIVFAVLTNLNDDAEHDAGAEEAAAAQIYS